MTPNERPERPDEGPADAGSLDGSEHEALECAELDDENGDAPVAIDMRFTVIDRLGGSVHLLSEGGGVLFAHPAISDAVWDAALDEVPDAWEIVDLPEAIADVVPRYWHPSQGCGEPDVDGLDADEFALRQFELLTSFVRAGFDRAEAMALVLELLRSEGPDL
jgi:hypothetical protein